MKSFLNRSERERLNAYIVDNDCKPGIWYPANPESAAILLRTLNADINNKNALAEGAKLRKIEADLANALKLEPASSTRYATLTVSYGRCTFKYTVSDEFAIPPSPPYPTVPLKHVRKAEWMFRTGKKVS